MRAAVLVLLLGVLAVCVSPTLTVARRPLPDGNLLRGLGLRVHQLTTEAMSSFSGYSTSKHSPHLALSMDDDACCDCVSSVGHHILNASMEAVKKSCTNVTCPFIKQRCEWAEAHPKEIAGYLAVKVRPFSFAYAYCMGNATCEHPSAPKATKTMTTALLSADSTAQPDLWVAQLASAARYVGKALKGKIEKIEQEAEDWAKAQLSERSSRNVATFSRRMRAEESESVMEEEKDAESSKGCHKCLRKSVKWVLKQAGKHLKEACEKTECPGFQKFCGWAKDHKEVVKGMLYAKITPYRYAIGWCAGKGACGKGDEIETVYNAPFTMGEHHHEQTIGGDGHDQQVHGSIIGGGDHDMKPHGGDEPRMGGDGHDSQPHGGSAIGGDGHDSKPHGGSAIGGDGHDSKPHRRHPNGLRTAGANLVDRAKQVAETAARVAQAKGHTWGRIFSGRKH